MVGRLVRKQLALVALEQLQEQGSVLVELFNGFFYTVQATFCYQFYRFHVKSHFVSEKVRFLQESQHRLRCTIYRSISIVKVHLLATS